MLNHLDKQGRAQMVDVSNKSDTVRVATACSRVEMSQHTFERITSSENPKGDVFATVRIAGIQAAKKCSELIPLCHPLMLNSVNVEINTEPDNNAFNIICTCKINGKTGVEMEALTGASIAALTLYDMCKAIDKGIVIRETKLLKKSGGKSGPWQRADQ